MTTGKTPASTTHPRGRLRGGERGSVLLIALAVLALMALFATAFYNLVTLERQASANYVEGRSAELLASAGLARAEAEFRRRARTQAWSDPRDG